MNDDPTQLFPETLWKRYATEAVSVPARHVTRLIPAPNTAVEISRPVLPAAVVKTLVKLPTQPLLS